MPNIISAFWAIIVIASPKAAMAVTAMMMTAWTATAAMPRVTTIAVMTAINAVMSAPAMTGRVTIVPAMTVSVVAGMIATGMAAAVMTVPVTNVPVTNVRVTSARVKTVPVKIGHVKIGHVKIVAPTATAVIGSVIAVIAGRNGWSSRGIRIQLMHRRSMTANRFCRRCHPPSRAARAVT
jgi:hypothetical protein